MSRVLVLAYFFPPLGGAGVQRSAKFVKYLPALGYDPIVITGPAAVGGPFSPADPTLMGDVPSGTRVERIRVPEPEAGGRWRSRAERWLGAPRPFSRWWVEQAVATGLQAGREVDLIYASMSPFESGTAAARLARSLGKPWIADLRDPWALDEVVVYPTAAHRRLALARMRRTLASAAAVVMNTFEAAAIARELPELRSTPVVTIPNGFDEDDFAGAPPDRGDSAFRIVHAGFAHTEPVAGRASKALRGAVPGYDLMTRSHVNLLSAVDALLETRPELQGTIEVHLAGFISDEERERIRSSRVHVHGYLNHGETIALLRSGDLLFLPMHDLPPGRRARTVPGKTYEYLASGRPILAAVPDGDARDLLGRAGTAFLCRPSDVDAMARIIGEQVDRERRGEPVPPLDASLLASYERQSLTQQLALVFDNVLERSSVVTERPRLDSAERNGKAIRAASSSGLGGM